MMRKDSDEYRCLHNALNSVERVADYINEMQRISETYTPIFQELATSYNDIEVSFFHYYGAIKIYMGILTWTFILRILKHAYFF